MTLCEDAAQASLAIDGVVADIRCYGPAGTFDAIVIDRTLHMLPGPDRLAVLERLTKHVNAKGYHSDRG